jgi:hypothetical protein
MRLTVHDRVALAHRKLEFGSGANLGQYWDTGREVICGWVMVERDMGVLTTIL